METEKKATNPKDAVGTGKAPISTLSAQVIAEIGLAMLEGARKYGRHNYRVAGVRGSVYYDAALRHLGAWWEGQDTDPDSGLSHVTKALACLTVLRDSMLQGNWTDDRPPKAANPEWLAELNAKAKGIIERYPDALPAHTAVGVADTVEGESFVLPSRLQDNRPINSPTPLCGCPQCKSVRYG